MHSPFIGRLGIGRDFSHYGLEQSRPDHDGIVSA
jgi:hypothetical protein